MFIKKAAGVFALAASASALSYSHSEEAAKSSSSFSSSSSSSSVSSKSTCEAKTVTSTSSTTVYKSTTSAYKTTVNVGYGPAKTVTVDDGKKITTTKEDGEWHDWAPYTKDPESSSSSSSYSSKYSTVCDDVTKVITTTVTSDVTTFYGSTVYIGYGPGPTYTCDGSGKTIGSYIPDGWPNGPDGKATVTATVDGGYGTKGGNDDGAKTTADGGNKDGNGYYGGKDGEKESSKDDGAKTTTATDGGKKDGNGNGNGNGWGSKDDGAKTTTVTDGDKNGNGSKDDGSKTTTVTDGGKNGNGYNGGNKNGNGSKDDGSKTTTVTDDGDKSGHGSHGGNGGNKGGDDDGKDDDDNEGSSGGNYGNNPDPNNTKFWGDWRGRPIGGGKIIKTVDNGDGGWSYVPPNPEKTSTSFTTDVTVSNSRYAEQTRLPQSEYKNANSKDCNSASDRSSWSCGGSYSIKDDNHKVVPQGNVRKFDFVITNTTLNYDGINRLALAINGQVPGPLIEVNWGDTVEVTVTNKMQDNATTIHWHGIRQSGSVEQDGVPGITECAIAPGKSRTYKFVADTYGTGWYHGHLLTQIGDGIRGPMVIHGPASANYDYDMGTVMIDDLWNSATVAQMNYKFAHIVVLPGAPPPVTPSADNYMLNGHNVDANLTSGKHALWTLEPGKKHLFRLINSASQNSWTVRIDNHKFTVIAADYVPIKPYTTEWVKMGNGQRYDVIVEADQAIGNYFFRAVTQVGCPAATVNNGLGFQNGIVTYKGANLTLPLNNPGANATFFAGCEDEPIESLVPVVSKSGGSSSALSASLRKMTVPAIQGVVTSDDGTVNTWFINGASMNVNFTQPTLKTIATGSYNSSLVSNPIVVDVEGVQWVYFVIQNAFPPSHPMHLHGHDLALLGQGQGVFTDAMVSTLNFENPTRRDTVMLKGRQGSRNFAPGYTVIGFETDNPGAWVMHCHILWHADGGLALQWVERPGDISTKIASSDAFKQECADMVAYESEGPWRLKTSHSSGLKRRGLFDFDSGDVVRRSESSEKRYLENIAKRAVGDGYKPRHARR